MKNEKPALNRDIRDAWARAVEDGSFNLGRGCLARRYDGLIFHCPLGILCELAVRANVIQRAYWIGGGWNGPIEQKLYEGQQGVLPQAVVRWAGVVDVLPRVNPTMEQRKRWGLPDRFQGRKIMVPLNRINDHTEATPQEMAELIRRMR